MTSPGRGVARALRGSLLASCCTLLALAGHLAGGGRATALLPMLIGAAALTAWFIVCAERPRTTAQVVAAAMGSQVVFHVILSFCGSTSATAGERGAAATVLGHALAAALSGWVLARGDAAVWSLYHLLRELVSVVMVRPHVVTSPPCGAHRADTAAAGCGAGMVLAAAHPRRGPPVVGVARLAAAG